MYKIALVCQHGASTGLCVQKMIGAASANGIEAQIASYPDSQLANLVESQDLLLLGPQLSFKKERFQKEFNSHKQKIVVINAMDFGMMDGEKILRDAISYIESLKQAKEGGEKNG